jgi:hypothetical protein
MDRQRHKIETRTGIAESLDINGVGNPCAPHPWAGREDLKSIRPELVGCNGGIFE